MSTGYEEPSHSKQTHIPKNFLPPIYEWQEQREAQKENICGHLI